MSVLAIDAGTTGVTALVVTADGRVAARGYQEFRAALPQAGLGGARAGGDLAGHPGGRRDRPRRRTTGRSSGGVGITNQRETVVLWDRETLARPAARDRLAGPPHREMCDGSARRGTRSGSPS